MSPFEQLFSQVPSDKEMNPSATGRDYMTYDLGHPADPSQAGRGWESYARMMKLLTQPPRDMGPAGRRAEAGMPAGPKDIHDPVQLQEAPHGSGLMALLFGGGGK
jgi:hypothetical protein